MLTFLGYINTGTANQSKYWWLLVLFLCTVISMLPKIFIEQLWRIILFSCQFLFYRLSMPQGFYFLSDIAFKGVNLGIFLQITWSLFKMGMSLRISQISQFIWQWRWTNKLLNLLTLAFISDLTYHALELKHDLEKQTSWIYTFIVCKI